MDEPTDHRARKAYWLLGPDGRPYESAPSNSASTTGSDGGGEHASSRWRAAAGGSARRRPGDQNW